MIDSHCHPYLFKNNIKKILLSFKSKWWEYLVSIAVDIESSKKSISIAKSYDFIYSTIWIQPNDTIKYNKDIDWAINKLEDLYIKNKENIVWIWECWLDYYWIKSLINDKLNEKDIKSIQKDFFKKQILLAKKYNLPVIIHNRNAKEDTFKILKEINYKNFIFHCYSEDLNFAKKLLDFNPKAIISFSWIVTFQNAKEIQEVAKNIPLQNIIIETDAPFLTPVPFRWKQENKPELVKYILEKIIKLREEKTQDIENKILKNTKKIFHLK